MRVALTKKGNVCVLLNGEDARRLLEIVDFYESTTAAQEIEDLDAGAVLFAVDLQDRLETTVKGLPK